MATKEQIDAARKAYDDASWAIYDAPVWRRQALVTKRERLRRALLKLDPGHFSKLELESFAEATRKTNPEGAEQMIAGYVTSDVAKELDRV